MRDFGFGRKTSWILICVVCGVVALVTALRMIYPANESPLPQRQPPSFVPYDEEARLQLELTVFYLGTTQPPEIFELSNLAFKHNGLRVCSITPADELYLIRLLFRNRVEQLPDKVYECKLDDRDFNKRLVAEFGKPKLLRDDELIQEYENLKAKWNSAYLPGLWCRYDLKARYRWRHMAFSAELFEGSFGSMSDSIEVERAWNIVNGSLNLMRAKVAATKQTEDAGQ